MAFSGGPDSTALLSGLVELKSALKIKKIRAIHVNHSLRPKTAQRDANHSRNVAKALGVEFKLVKVNTKAEMRHCGISMEMAARKLRYAGIENHAYAHGLIAFAHTRDDLAETSLLRFIKGSGPAGIAAIPAVRGRFARPLINATRPEIMDYITQNKLSCVQDETNLMPIAERNRLRLQVIPLIEKQLNPGIRDTLAANAEFYCAIDEFLSCEAANLMKVSNKKSGGLSVDLKKFNSFPIAVRAYFLREAIEKLKGDVSHLRISNLMKAAAFDRSGKTMKIAGDLHVSTDAGKLVLKKKSGLLS